MEPNITDDNIDDFLNDVRLYVDGEEDEYKEWGLKPSWTHSPDPYFRAEIIYLLLGLEPVGGAFVLRHTHLQPTNSGLKGKRWEFKKSYFNIADILERSLNVGELPCQKQSYTASDGVPMTEYYVKPRDVISWAKDKGIQVPEPFMVLLDPLEGGEPQPDHIFTGRDEIKKQFTETHNISSWGGIREKMKRNGVEFGRVKRKGKDSPAITLKEIQSLTK